MPGMCFPQVRVRDTVSRTSRLGRSTTRDLSCPLLELDHAGAESIASSHSGSLLTNTWPQISGRLLRPNVYSHRHGRHSPSHPRPAIAEAQLR